MRAPTMLSDAESPRHRRANAGRNPVHRERRSELPRKTRKDTKRRTTKIRCEHQSIGHGNHFNPEKPPLMFMPDSSCVSSRFSWQFHALTLMRHKRRWQCASCARAETPARTRVDLLRDSPYGSARPWGDRWNFPQSPAAGSTPISPVFPVPRRPVDVRPLAQNPI